MEEYIMQLIAANGGNEFLVAGIVMGILAATYQNVKSVPGKIYAYFQRRYVFTLKVTDSEPAYEYVASLLKNNPKFHKMRNRNITDEGNLSVGEGNFWYFKNFRFYDVYVERTKLQMPFSAGESTDYLEGKKKEVVLSKIGRAYEDVITIWIYGFGNLKAAEELMTDARSYYREVIEKEKTEIAVCDNDGYFEKMMPVRESLGLVDTHGKYEEILRLCKEFVSNRKWYEERNIPYHIGFLLEGEPGNGKSTIPIRVAQCLARDVSILMAKDLSKTFLRTKAVCVLEDIDAAFEEEAGEDGFVNRSEKIGSLLNMLDGSLAKENIIYFLTTNRANVLDKALIRPGRVDYRIPFLNPDKEEVADIFNIFYSSPKSVGKSFAEKVPEGVHCVAAIQGHCMRYRDNYQEAIKNAHKISSI